MTVRTLGESAPTSLAIAAITLYQRSISPRKGWQCAHRVRHGGHSCSEWTKRAVARHGLRIGALLARRRFARCHTASMPSRWESDEEREARTCPQSRGGAILAACANPIDAACTSAECLSCGCDFLQMFGWLGL